MSNIRRILLYAGVICAVTFAIVLLVVFILRCLRRSRKGKIPITHQFGHLDGFYIMDVFNEQHDSVNSMARLYLGSSTSPLEEDPYTFARKCTSFEAKQCYAVKGDKDQENLQQKEVTPEGDSYRGGRYATIREIRAFENKIGKMSYNTSVSLEDPYDTVVKVTDPVYQNKNALKLLLEEESCEDTKNYNEENDQKNDKKIYAELGIIIENPYLKLTTAKQEYDFRSADND